jgi:hypothetical protein
MLASLLFLLFGLWILVDGALRGPGWALVITATVAAIAVLAAISRWLLHRDAQPPPGISAERSGR